MKGHYSTAERALIFGAGNAATLAMMATSRAAGSPVMADLHELAATVAAPPGSTSGDALAYAATLLNGGMFAQCYAAAFDVLPIGPSWRSGLGLGLAHGVLAGAVLGAVAPVHPRVPEDVPPPGLFMRRRGVDASIALVALHGIYGAVVGGAVAFARRRRSRNIAP